MTSNRTPNRRGVTMVIVVAVLMMLAIIGGALLRLAVLQAGRGLRDADRAQAAWLAEAGLERAWSKLKRDPAYRGETWQIPGADLNGKPATVRITAQSVADQPLAIEVQAEYPVGSTATVRTTKTFEARPAQPGAPSP